MSSRMKKILTQGIEIEYSRFKIIKKRLSKIVYSEKGNTKESLLYYSGTTCIALFVSTFISMMTSFFSDPNSLTWIILFPFTVSFLGFGIILIYIETKSSEFQLKEIKSIVTDIYYEILDIEKE